MKNILKTFLIPLLLLTIVLPCISQVKLTIEGTNHICYTSEDNRIIGLIILEGDMCKAEKEIILDENKNYKYAINSMQSLIDIQTKLIEVNNKDINNARVYISDLESNLQATENKLNKSKTVGISSIILNIVLFLIVVL